MPPSLLFLLAIPCEVFLFAVIATRLHRRSGVPGLVVAAVVLWFVSTKTAALAETFGPPAHEEGIALLVFLAELIGLTSLVVIGVQVRRQARAGPEGQDSPAPGVTVRSALKALAIGTLVIGAVALAALIFFSQVAP
jgi:hypothetical protein